MYKIALLIGAASAVAAGAAANDPKAPQQGFFSQPQVDRGKSLYEANCARCHGADLAGVLGTPGLQGRFIQHWQGSSLGEVAEFIQNAMPIDNPGSLDRQASVDILAYLVASNGYRKDGPEIPISDDGLAKMLLGPPAH